MSSYPVIEGVARDILKLSLASAHKEPYPANTKNVAGKVGGVDTNLASIYFGDKIMITISQAGRLAQWVRLQPLMVKKTLIDTCQIQVPLSTASPTTFNTRLPAPSRDSMPAVHIAPTTLLGAGGDERETFGHLVASEIAILVQRKNPDEQRTVVIGIGLLKVDLDRTAWFDLLELIAKVI